MKEYTALIILNYNNVEDTLNCIDSVEIFNSAAIKYIIVDNGSSRHNASSLLQASLKERFKDRLVVLTDKDVPLVELPYVTLVESSTNDGYAQGNNKGLKLAYEDRSITKVMILNNDILFVEDIIPGLLKYLKDLPDAAIVSPMLYSKELEKIDYTCARRKSTIGEEILYNTCSHFFCSYVESKLRKRYILLDSDISKRVIPIDLPSGSCMLLEKQMFVEIGSFDPHTFLYWEEQILHEKIRKIGKQNYLCTDFKCIHVGGAATVAFVGSLFTLKCGNESSLYYWRHYSNCSEAAYITLRISIWFNTLLSVVRIKLSSLKKRL